MTRRKREIVGLTNERVFAHLVELALPPGGFRSIFLEVDAFHRDRRIPVRRGRSRHEARYIASHSDEIARRALLETYAQRHAAHNVMTLAKDR